MEAPRPSICPVLIVDDEIEIRRLLRKLCAKHQLPTRDAGNVEEALEIVAREPISAIFTDLQLPAANGHALVRTLRQQGLQTPVTYFTAHVSKADVEEARGLGAMHFLAKPCSLAQIEAVLLKMVSAA